MAKQVAGFLKCTAMVKSFKSTFKMSSQTNVKMSRASRWVKSRGKFVILNSVGCAPMAPGVTAGDEFCARLTKVPRSILGPPNGPDAFKWDINKPLEAYCTFDSVVIACNDGGGRANCKSGG